MVPGQRAAGQVGPPADWPVMALAVLLLAGIAVVSAVAGPAEFGEPRITVFSGVLDAPDVGPVDPAQPAEQPAPEKEGLPGWTWVAWSFLVVAMMVLVVRSVFSWLAADGSQEAGIDEPPGDGASSRLLAAVRRGVREADEELGSAVPGDAGDAVIRCWLALEAAASQVGTRRDRAETPTEFTTALLDSQAADAAATRTLLGLYHQARYGRTPLPPVAVVTARESLRRIALSLESGPAAAPRRRRAGRRG